MSWIKKFSSAEEGQQLENDLVMELSKLEDDGHLKPVRVYWLRAFRNETGIYVDAFGTREQTAILQKLGYEWNETEHATQDMILVFQQSADN